MSEPVSDTRGNGRDTQRDIDKYNHPTSTDVDKIKSLFMIIYQIRCNLEHGGKSPIVERYKKLREVSAPIISKIIEYVISLG